MLTRLNIYKGDIEYNNYKGDIRYYIRNIIRANIYKGDIDIFTDDLGDPRV